jgi:hypothetical protein
MKAKGSRFKVKDKWLLLLALNLYTRLAVTTYSRQLSHTTHPDRAEILTVPVYGNQDLKIGIKQIA